MKKRKNNKFNLKVKILSGNWKGRSISFLDKNDLRPTKNIIKETLFNWIQGDVKDSTCLDLFAGSGSLGFEAASRGAKKVYLIDNDDDISAQLFLQKEELEANNVSIFTSCAQDFVKNLKENISLVFLDPPFSSTIINKIIYDLSISYYLVDKCKIYIEIPNKKNCEFLKNIPTNWELLKNKKSGEVSYLLFQHNISMV